MLRNGVRAENEDIGAGQYVEWLVSPKMVRSIGEAISTWRGRGGESLLAKMRHGPRHVTGRRDKEDGYVAQQALRFYRTLIGRARPAFGKYRIWSEAEPDGKLLHLHGFFRPIAENGCIARGHHEPIGDSFGKEIRSA